MRNPYFHEWSHAAQPDGYPDRIVFRRTAIPRPRSPLSSAAAPTTSTTASRPTASTSCKRGSPASSTSTPPIGTRRAGPQHPGRAIQRCPGSPGDQLRDRPRQRSPGCSARGASPPASCCRPGLPGYRRYCPYTLDPNPAGAWHAPDLAKAERLIAASHTRGTPITIWDLGAVPDRLHPDRAVPRSRSSTGSDTRPGSKISRTDITRHRAVRRLAHEGASRHHRAQPDRTRPPPRSSKSNFACRSFVPDSTVNANVRSSATPSSTPRSNSALAAESNNSPDAAALWAQADRTATDDAPAVPLTTPSETTSSPPRRQLPIQLPARRAARPALGPAALAAERPRSDCDAPRSMRATNDGLRMHLDWLRSAPFASGSV